MGRVGIRVALLAVVTAIGSVLIGAAPAQAALQPAGGVVLDSWGGIHPFGGVTLNTANAPYWQGQDVARALVVLPDGSGGWTLDDRGGIHNWGTAPAPKCPCPYWVGQDVARALVVLSNRTSGYVLDDWGAPHEFGGAPHLTGGPYWVGQDVARGFDVHLNSAGVPDGGWVLDDWGGVHQFGGAPALAGSHYYPGFDFWRKLHVTGNGAGAYAVGKYGLTDKFGNPPGINWSGQSFWYLQDQVRDVVPVNPAGGWVNQPTNWQAASQLMVTLQNLDRVSRGIPAVGESATLDTIAGSNGGGAYNEAPCGGGNNIVLNRSQDMYGRGYFAHQIAGCAQGKNLACGAIDPTTGQCDHAWYVWDTYYKAYGIGWRTVGENIASASGYTSVTDQAWAVNNGWLSSPEHYANLTNRAFNTAGCGFYVAVWTCEFLA